MACIVVVALGAAVGALAAGGVFSSDSTGSPSTTTTTPQGSGGTTTTTPPTQTGTPVSTAAINDTLGAYETAYSDEDPDAIDRLLADDIVRTSDSGTMSGKAAVMKEYRRQFAATASPVYKFESVQVAPGVDMADVSGRYRITTAGGAPSTGTIKLHLVGSNDGLLIDRIDVVAD
jgi:ketosteroid isomerase-like protein